MKFGKLTEVNIRELWNHEQYDFSEWLAKPENIELLNEEVGLTLTDINKEVFVGSYRCDLVAVDETTGIQVIIENQLEATNHDHLGKIITYASGLDAEVIVWIVKEAREEHKSAIEWLNNNTNKNVSFFLIEIHAYRIGDSLPAPKFVIIEKPNDFSKQVRGSINGNELSKTQAELLNFWTQFNNAVASRNRPFNIRKATTNHWYDVAIGTSEANISISLANKLKKIWVDFYIRENKGLFDRLYLNLDKIHAELGFTMEWKRMDTKKASKITYDIDGLDFDNQDNYTELIDEIIEKVILIKKVFQKYI